MFAFSVCLLFCLLSCLETQVSGNGSPGVCSILVRRQGGNGRAALVKLNEAGDGDITDIDPLADQVLQSITRDPYTGIFYIAGRNRVFTYDPCSGNNNLTEIGQVINEANSRTVNGFRGIAFDPIDCLLYFIENRNMVDYLWKINPDTLTGVEIGSTQLTQLNSLVFGSDGTLYSWSGNAADSIQGLITIDKTTANVTSINGQSGFNIQSLALDPLNEDFLYGILSGGIILSIDKSLGTDGVVSTELVAPGSLTLLRGMYILDQEGCDEVTDCDIQEKPTQQPSEEPTGEPSEQPTGEPIFFGVD